MRPGDKKNFFQCFVATNILENGKVIRQLNLDTPILAHMKAELNRLRNNQRTDTQKDKTSELPASSLTIPFDSIAG